MRTHWLLLDLDVVSLQAKENGNRRFRRTRNSMGLISSQKRGNKNHVLCSPTVTDEIVSSRIRGNKNSRIIRIIRSTARMNVLSSWLWGNKNRDDNCHSQHNLLKFTRGTKTSRRADRDGRYDLLDVAGNKFSRVRGADYSVNRLRKNGTAGNIYPRKHAL